MAVGDSATGSYGHQFWKKYSRYISIEIDRILSVFY